MEQDLETLAACDRLALERFQMLDAMEVRDETSGEFSNIKKSSVRLLQLSF